MLVSEPALEVIAAGEGFEVLAYGAVKDGYGPGEGCVDQADASGRVGADGLASVVSWSSTMPVITKNKAPLDRKLDPTAARFNILIWWLSASSSGSRRQKLIWLRST